ncbi:MAG: hypothetical protein WD824_07800 [Cyclobacteriaceae bacterium]
MQVAEQFKEIFRTANGCVYQCDKKRCFGVDFAGYMTEYKIPCFFALKKLIDRIDLDEMALNPEKASDIEIVSPCGSERCYVLTLPELLEFKTSRRRQGNASVKQYSARAPISAPRRIIHHPFSLFAN